MEHEDFEGGLCAFWSLCVGHCEGVGTAEVVGHGMRVGNALRVDFELGVSSTVARNWELAGFHVEELSRGFVR